jgi:GNAT superfamily N-acetyltransferase
MRAAGPTEADDLTALLGRSIGHWGHPENFPDRVAELVSNDRVTPEFIDNCIVRVLDDDGAVAGFYGLERHVEFLDLKYMFLEPQYIGGGNGRVLWNDALAHAEHPSGRMRIVSDPMAKDFYRVMGAELEKEIEVAPGFSLGLMWFDL